MTIGHHKSKAARHLMKKRGLSPSTVPGPCVAREQVQVHARGAAGTQSWAGTHRCISWWKVTCVAHTGRRGKCSWPCCLTMNVAVRVQAGGGRAGTPRMQALPVQSACCCLCCLYCLLPHHQECCTLSRPVGLTVLRAKLTLAAADGRTGE